MVIRPSRTDIVLYDNNGKPHPAYILQHWIDASSQDGEQVIPGQMECHLVDGAALNYVDENAFKNVITGEILTRRRTK